MATKEGDSKEMDIMKNPEFWQTIATVCSKAASTAASEVLKQNEESERAKRAEKREIEKHVREEEEQKRLMDIKALGLVQATQAIAASNLPLWKPPPHPFKVKPLWPNSNAGNKALGTTLT